MKTSGVFWFTFILSCVMSSSLVAQSRTAILDAGADPRGEPELIVCSQNLENYGLLKDVEGRVQSADAEWLEKKMDALVTRFMNARCDVAAVQEVISKDIETGKKALEVLAEHWRQRSNRFFEVRAGASNDKTQRIGFLVARDRAEILNMLSYAQVELPKLSENQQPRFFTRGPLELQLKVKPRGETFSKVVTLVNFHFKSKRPTSFDPSGLEFETLRMEMSEGLRRVVFNRHEKVIQSGDAIVMLLGDRNSNFDTASAKILDGSLQLKQFQGDAVCRLSDRGVALCQAGIRSPQRLFSVLVTDPETGKLPGTQRYKKVYSWLDDILMPGPSLPFAWKNFGKEGDYDSGVVYEPRAASDHALVWVALNW